MSRNPAGDKTTEMTSEAWHLAGVQPRAQADFDALFLTHYEEIFRLLYRVVGSREEAEDLAQETFLRLSRQSFSADREHYLRAWLYRVASNLAFNWLRGRGRRLRREETAATQAVLTSSALTDPAEAAVRSDERAGVRWTLAQLPERQAQLLLLRHSGLSYREVAAALGVAPGSVGTLLARAEAAFEKLYARSVTGTVGEGGGA